VERTTFLKADRSWHGGHGGSGHLPNRGGPGLRTEHRFDAVGPLRSAEAETFDVYLVTINDEAGDSITELTIGRGRRGGVRR
jgi:hypothetical protein